MNHLPTISDSDRALQVLGELCDGFDVFGNGSAACDVRVVGVEHLPESYRRLLGHDRHMTTTLRECFADDLVLRVLAERSAENVYRRWIELALARTGAVAEVGIVRLDTEVLPPVARTALLERRRPLGDILIGFGVLTRVEVRWFLRLAGSGGCLNALHGTTASPVYGRLATIHCNGRPALDLFEVVTDDPRGAAG